MHFIAKDICLISLYNSSVVPIKVINLSRYCDVSGFLLGVLFPVLYCQVIILSNENECLICAIFTFFLYILQM